MWGARRAKYPRRPRRVALWGDLGGVQFSVTEVNREGRAPARPRALSIAASKLFRIIISEAIVTEVGEISLRKTEMVGRVQEGQGILGKMRKDGIAPQRHAPRAARVLRAPGPFGASVYPRKSSCRNANSPRRAAISRGDAEARRI